MFFGLCFQFVFTSYAQQTKGHGRYMPVPRNLCEGEEYRPAVGRVQPGSYTNRPQEKHLLKFSAKFRTLTSGGPRGKDPYIPRCSRI
jgi:hypothetical protein